MSESKNTVTVEVDLDQMAKQVADYYSTMQDGQVAELLGDKDAAFQKAKEVISIMAKILEDAVGLDNVMRVNDLVADLQVAASAKLEGE